MHRRRREENAKRLADFRKEHAKHMKRHAEARQIRDAAGAAKVENQEYIEYMTAASQHWVQPDQVEERIIQALDNPLRLEDI